MRKYEYLDREPISGDVVEFVQDWEAYGRPKGSLAIVKDLTISGNPIIKDNRGDKQSYSASFVKVVKTLPVTKDTKVGAQVICVSVAVNYSVEPKIESVQTVVGHSAGWLETTRNVFRYADFRVLVLDENKKSDKEVEEVKEAKGATMPKKKQENRLRVFAKNGTPSCIGLIYQAAKFGLIDRRPFVTELLEQTCNTLIPNGIKGKLNEALKAYDLVAAGHYATVQKYLEHKKDSDKPISLLLKVYAAHAMLLGDKARKTKADYTWIKDFLTRENIEATTVELYASNKLAIFIEDGQIIYNSADNIFKFDIKYDEKTNSFYL